MSSRKISPTAAAVLAASRRGAFVAVVYGTGGGRWGWYAHRRVSALVILGLERRGLLRCVAMRVGVPAPGMQTQYYGLPEEEVRLAWTS